MSGCILYVLLHFYLLYTEYVRDRLLVNSLDDFCLWAPSQPELDLSATRNTEVRTHCRQTGVNTTMQ